MFQYFFLLLGLIMLGCSIGDEDVKKELRMKKLVNMSIQDVEEYADEYGLELIISYEYDSNIPKDIVISQSVDIGSFIYDGDVIELMVSKGKVPISEYQEYQVNELGKVPIMMYHGIINVTNDETKYVGGNVDKDGYNRTVESFRNDLEFYYQNDYRMMRLQDYIDGIIDVDLGKSPIILTFDDGNENNFRVLGEENGELVIDPNCAIGVLEEFKNKYPDYGVTATFFVNSELFKQDNYNVKILKWLIEHGYDIGNHTLSHVDFTKIGIEDTVKEVGGLYRLLNQLIGDQYVSILALPFGSPYKREHSNYEYILNGNYMGLYYNTKAVLRVGWEAELSCFDIVFDSTFLKRIRAYDNNGKDFDIEMNFEILKDSRYISDGDKDTIVILEKDKDRVKDKDREVIYY